MKRKIGTIGLAASLAFGGTFLAACERQGEQSEIGQETRQAGQETEQFGQETGQEMGQLGEGAEQDLRGAGE